MSELNASTGPLGLRKRRAHGAPMIFRVVLNKVLASNGFAKTKTCGDRIGLMNKFWIIYGAYERISSTGAGALVF